MNPRERFLAMCVLGIVIVAGAAFLGYQFYMVPLQERDASIAALKLEIERKREDVRRVMADRPKLERWRQLSLPVDSDLARREYEKYLSEQMRQSGFASGSFTVTPKAADTRTSPTLPGRKEPIYIRLTFTVLAHADLSSLVTFLDRFYHTGMLHQIKNLSIVRPLTTASQQRRYDLDINLTIEALIVTGAEGRSFLLPALNRRVVALEAAAALRGAPPGLALAAWAAGPTGPIGPRTLADPPRQYASIADKDIFFGPPPGAPQRSKDDVDVIRYVYLTDITQTVSKTEAFLYDRYNNLKTRLRSSAGFDSFRIRDGEGDTVLQGKVIRINDRDLVILVEEKYYMVHVGESLREALAHPLKKEDVVSLEAPKP
jgi:hypothetical protein